jgi:hypothetical protein
VLNAVQQLTSGLGIAVLGTVFFDALGAGHFHRALAQTLWLDAGLLAATVLLTPLLPRRGIDAEAALLAAA